jgi:hypothetical protein
MKNEKYIKAQVEVFYKELVKELWLKKHEFNWKKYNGNGEWQERRPEPNSHIWVTKKISQTHVVKKLMKDTKFYDRLNGRSKAGSRSMKLCYRNMFWNDTYWHEYGHINKDPVIGYTKINDYEDRILLLVAHELAHYIEMTYTRCLPDYLRREVNTLPHGKRWQGLYRIMRYNVVNPFIQQKAQGFRNSNIKDCSELKDGVQ